MTNYNAALRSNYIDGLLQNDRARLIEATQNDHKVTYLATILANLAEHEGMLWVADTIARREGQGRTYDLICEEITFMLLQGADDTWSGRHNDVQRSRYDGIRYEARRYIEDVV